MKSLLTCLAWANTFSYSSPLPQSSQPGLAHTPVPGTRAPPGLCIGHLETHRDRTAQQELAFAKGNTSPMLGLDPFSKRSIIIGHLLCSAQALKQTLNPASKGFGRSLTRAPMLRLGHCRTRCSPFPQGSRRAVNAAPPFCSFPRIIKPKAEVLKCTSTSPSNRALLSGSKHLG